MPAKPPTARPDIDFWQQRYLTGNTPWDNGQDAAACTAGLFEADVLTWTPPLPLGAIIERTCLCALHPDVWVAYSRRLHAWLRPGGRLFAQFEQVPRAGAAQGLLQGPPLSLRHQRHARPVPWRSLGLAGGTVSTR